MMARTPRAEQEKAKRKQRKAKWGSPELKLTLDPETMEKFKREGLIARWSNDTGSNIQQRLMKGYEFVHDTEGQITVGDDDGNSDMGSRVSRIAGTNKDGTPLRQYLMVQTKENYDEDQALKERVNAQVDEAIRHGRPGGPQQTSMRDESGSKTYVKNVEYQP
jgi:hypothetical protein